MLMQTVIVVESSSSFHKSINRANIAIILLTAQLCKIGLGNALPTFVDLIFFGLKKYGVMPADGGEANDAVGYGCAL